jgi:hypothetical protein
MLVEQEGLCPCLWFDQQINNDLKSEKTWMTSEVKIAGERHNPTAASQRWYVSATVMPREPARASIDPCLLDLPSYALNLLVSKSRGFYFRHPLLRVGRAGRDAVLQGTKNASLQLRPEDNASTVAPLTRMLSRVCATAAAGLRLHIRSQADETEGSSNTERDADALLATLLEPGLQQPDGWPKVHSLELAVRPEHLVKVHARAFFSLLCSQAGGWLQISPAYWCWSSLVFGPA